MRHLLLLCVFFLAGCAVYRVAPENDAALKAAHVLPSSKVEVVKQSRFPDGFQCFEPMLFVLTIGIVPAHCVDTYTASAFSSNGEQVSGTYKLTRMQGWLPLLLLPFSGWHYGLAQQPEVVIEATVKGITK